MGHTHLLHTQMIKAIEAQDVQKVQNFIAQGVQVNYINNSCATSAIEAATRLGDLEMVTLLLSVKKADPNQWYMRSPLVIALENGFVDIANLLMDSGADVNTDPSLDLTPLMCAVSLNNFQLVKKLIDKGADTNSWGRESNPPLSIAASEGYKDIYEYLLPLINQNYLDEFLEEGVWCAIYDKSLVGIEFLASVGANLNCKNSSLGDTPLTWVIEREHLSLAKKLIELGADIKLKGRQELTPLSIAKEKEYDEIVQLLLDVGAREE